MEKYYWLNDESRKFLKRGYLLPGVEPEERILEIAKKAEDTLKIEGFAAKFEDYMSRGFYSLSTPVWVNYGLDNRGLGISCFGIAIQDDLSDILRSVSEIGVMTSNGGGTAGYMGNLRHRGASISRGGESGGPVHFMELFEAVSSVVTQGEARRGHFAAYFPVEHKDINEFLNCRTDGHPIQHLSTAVTIKDEWMEQMIAGDKEKREIWAKILKRRSETGYPFIFFHDNVNRGKPQAYKDKGMEIKHSQMCVTADQRVVTSEGLKTVFELYLQGKPLTLFDNDKVVQSTKMTLIEKDVDVYEIELDNGLTHKVTDYHKLKVLNGNQFEDVMCKDLKIGNSIAIQTNKGLFGMDSNVDEAYLLGVLQSYKKENLGLEDKVQRDAIDSLHKNIKNGGLLYTDEAVPNWIFESDEKTIWSYLKGLLSLNNSNYITDENNALLEIRYSDNNLNFLKTLLLLFNNLGLNASIKNYDNTKDFLSIENKNSFREIDNYTGILSGKGFKLSEENEIPLSSARIINISHVGKEDVYCVTVDSNEHHWICNGVVTGNCTEIMEYTDDKNSFTCCLSSINLLHIDEILQTDAIETLTYFLDTVMTDFIEKASGIPYMEKAVHFAKNHRSIGVGVLGWHSYLQSKMIPFESMESKQFNSYIFKKIDERTLQASKELAKMFGSPSVLEGYGERFTTRVAIAPTTSSSFILGQVSPSIEPLASNYFINDLAKIKSTYKNPYLKTLLEEKGKNTPEIWESIMKKGGSVQHLDFLTEKEKFVFKTFGEISQLEIVQQAAARQKFIDQGQSLNLMIHPSTPLKDINKLLIEAWKLGIKTLYYNRSTNKAQEVSRDINLCVSCEA